ncbi:MAG: type IV toxin-antitoxin system AbiEi family antitoxin domain-containing protein [Atopobiaceae bacterium]
MAMIDDIYDAVDDYGLVTSSEACDLGVSNQALVQLSRRGKLVRMARGVYRVPVWPYQEQAPYAIAVKAAGEGAYLFGESVVALLELVPTDPRRMWIATPKRARRRLGEGVTLVERHLPDEIAYYEAIPCQRVGGAIVSAARTLGTKRAIQAAAEALRQGYITQEEKDRIEGELGDAKET